MSLDGATEATWKWRFFGCAWAIKGSTMISFAISRHTEWDPLVTSLSLAHPTKALSTRTGSCAGYVRQLRYRKGYNGQGWESLQR